MKNPKRKVKRLKPNRIIASFLFFLFAFTANGKITYCQTEPSSPFQKIKPIPEKFERLRFSEIKPDGWMKRQLEEDLAGFIGNLDRLVPNLIVKDDIYGKDRLTKKVKSKDVGAISTGADWEVEFLWWNSETQSNWRDGYIRSAILTGDKKHLAKIENYVERILDTQDTDGYIGIYDEELRYKFDSENGELWAKATVLRGLLAWYEYTRDRKILTAIEHAVRNVMANYPVENSQPFRSKKPDNGGLAHGLTFTDVLERLYQITGNEKYRDYALFLYKDFSTQILNEDAQYKKLLDPNLALKGHGVHTYEHLRSVAAAYYASGNPYLKKALDNFLVKIRRNITPSGAVIGDEHISGRAADATDTGYEFCSLHEMLDGYADLLAKTGESSFGDQVELLFFNAAQGARHPSESCIAYLKTDNSYEMTGTRNGDTRQKNQTRYKYSAVHQDNAVCCVPNAGRITPYYVQAMWMKDDEGLIATLLGASEVSTLVNGKLVKIKEITDYPYQNTFTFQIENKAQQNFKLKIRQPEWAKAVKTNQKFTEKNGFLEFDVAKKNEVINLTFEAEVKLHDFKGENYISYGALIFAKEISAWETLKEKYPLAGFPDRFYTAKDSARFSLPKVAKFQVFWNEKESLPEIETVLINSDTKKEEKYRLAPMGKTILRQVTFK